MFRGAFPVITTRAGLNMVYFQQYAQHRELYTSVFNMKTSTRGFEDFVKLSGLGRMRTMGEGETLTYDEAVEGSRVTAAHTLYGLGFQVSRLLWDDDQYGIMERMSEALARSVRYEQEVQAFALINDADAGATFTGFDSLPLIDDSHVLLNSSSTNDNRLAADLSASSLESCIDLFAAAVDESNMNVSIEPRMLLVPSQNRWLAATLLESEYDPESASQIPTASLS
jgi:phage major head subunit gpT-like protein